MIRNVLTACLAVAIGGLSAAGQDKPPPARLPTTRPAAPAVAGAKPAVKPAAAGGSVALKATVVSVTGLAEKRLAAQAGSKWQPIEAGDMLGEMSLVRTGFGSKVVLRLADRGEMTLRSCTKIGLGTFLKQGQTVRAEVGLKYGALRARVDRSRGPNDFRVSTPTATLSVRGSEADIAHWGDVLTGVRSRDSSWSFQVGGRRVLVRKGELCDGELTPWHVLGPVLAYVAITDPFGSTAAEIWNVVNHGTNRGIFGFDATGVGTTAVSASATPPTNFTVTIIPRKVP